MVLCFGTVTKTVLSTHCFDYCWTHCTPVRQAGDGEETGTQLGELTPPDQEISHAIWHHAQQQKLNESRKRGVTFVVMVFVFPSKHHAWWRPAVLEMLSNCLLIGSRESFSYLALLYLLNYELSLSQTMSFLTFSFQFSSPSPGGGWARGCVGLRTYWG